MKHKIVHAVVIFLAGLVLVSMISACGGGGSTTSSTPSDGATLSGSAQ
jgi:hypothetical protein